MVGPVNKVVIDAYACVGWTAATEVRLRKIMLRHDTAAAPKNANRFPLTHKSANNPGRKLIGRAPPPRKGTRARAIFDCLKERGRCHVSEISEHTSLTTVEIAASICAMKKQGKVVGSGTRQNYFWDIAP